MKKRQRNFTVTDAVEKINKEPMFWIDGYPKYAVRVLRNEWVYADLCPECKKSFRKWIERK